MEDDQLTSIRPLIQPNSTDTWNVACSQQTSASPEKFFEVTNLLLEQVQLNSTHLFRADILYDSASELTTLSEKEATLPGIKPVSTTSYSKSDNPFLSVQPDFQDYQWTRRVIRRLIPRKPQLDDPLEQSCFIYQNKGNCAPQGKEVEILVVYQPHCRSDEEVPWYHPKVKALAYLYSLHETQPAVMSVHYLPFPNTPSPIPDRLERTFKSLLKTMLRLLTMPPRDKESEISQSQDVSTMALHPAALKDTILPQHVVQDTYTRLKQVYAADLIARWTESTEPSKHVFEDLSIAAFLIELWTTMYTRINFPGFVDIACGNGVLVYILIKEGFPGYGFDARRRKTWGILDIDSSLHEQVYIPKPFLDHSTDEDIANMGSEIHSGTFPRGTFIISNHADELTCWTPILAALSCPEAPLPFLAIPCCSHALDGSRHRYSAKDIARTRSCTDGVSFIINHDIDDSSQSVEEQPATGDLKTMRAAKQKLTGVDKSMYAFLTRKTASIAQELGIDVELTLMRIPSTRNIGIVGNRKRDLDAEVGAVSPLNETSGEDVAGRIRRLVECECSITGGIEGSARTWITKVKRLQAGQGRGKVNLKSHLAS